MTDELVERLTLLMGRLLDRDLLDDREFDYKYYARACLAEIEAAGMVVVPRERFEQLERELFAFNREYGFPAALYPQR
jgi:hypothetical protein